MSVNPLGAPRRLCTASTVAMPEKVNMNVPTVSPASAPAVAAPANPPWARVDDPAAGCVAPAGVLTRTHLVF